MNEIEHIALEAEAVAVEVEHKVALSVEAAAKHLGVAAQTLVFVCERGDFEVDRGPDGEIVAVHIK